VGRGRHSSHPDLVQDPKRAVSAEGNVPPVIADGGGLEAGSSPRDARSDEPAREDAGLVRRPIRQRVLETQLHAETSAGILSAAQLTTLRRETA